MLRSEQVGQKRKSIGNYTIENMLTQNNINQDQQKTIQKLNEEKLGKKYGILSMFRFADRIDYILIFFGIIFALLTGASIPIFALLWGNNIDNFKNADALVQDTRDVLLKFVYIGLGVIVFGWVMVACWNIAGERQAIRCKNKYLESLLSQQVGWFQCSNQFQISSTYSVDTAAYQNALSHNIAFILYIVGMIISGLVISFVKGWLMALVLLGSIPLIVISKYIYSRFILTKDHKQQVFYSQAGGRAEEALFSIKTVKMLNGENYELEKYNNSLQKSKQQSSKFFNLLGISVGCAFFFILSSFAFGLWYGSQCVRKTSSCSQSLAGQQYTVGIAFTVFFSQSIISFHLSHLPHSLKKLMRGIAATQRILKVIDREPRIKNPENGIKIENFKGIIKFNNVTFSYPKDPKKVVLNGLNLEINKKKIAFVGQSGCGKSTIIQLIMRFYDPDSGSITVDGVNLKDIDLVWWRQEMIGYVGQEPVLFATTIKQNLLFSAENSTEEKLTQALRKAKISDFINSLEKKMDTYVGSGGCQVSGGQKQRIAIARAIVRKPKMLILDEATSALDRKTEKQIQQTLNQISNDVISITIAHRTKTIMNSDQIFVIENGKVKESGRFEELEMFKNVNILLENEADGVKKDREQVENKQVEEIEQINQTQLEKIQTKKQNIVRRLITYYKSSYILLLIAFFATALIGSAFPVSTIFLARLTQQMLIPFNQNLEYETNHNSLIVFLISIGIFLACVLQINLLERIGEMISTKIRIKTFSKLLKLPVYWHEKEENNVSSVTIKLAIGSIRIKQMTTTSIFYIMEILFAIFSGIIIAFVFQWRLALIQFAFLPINFATLGFTVKIQVGQFGQKQEQATSGIISQAVTNIKTVYSLVYEKKILKNYSQILKKPLQSKIKIAIISGFFYGLGEALIFVLISVVYHIGAIFVRDYDVPIKNVFTVVFAMFFATVAIGQMITVIPNIYQCLDSSQQIFDILDTKDEQQIQVQQNSKMIKDRKLQGNIQLKNIKFKYPSRSSYLFNDLNLKVEKGKKVGFVGYSGCGKSTIMSFLLRFYEPESGEITIDGINIKDYDIHFLRSQFGVVSQQPVVFNASFKQNIQYNMKISDRQIIEAAKKANALDFINKNKQNLQYAESQYIISEDIIESSHSLRRQISIKLQKYEQQGNIENFSRVVGVKGGSISGGQKQRVAIARAILRKPEILLLDQATSALDSENQKKVIDCLDKIMENKTTISIAHKLETIMNLDLIYVFNRGIIVEQGTYQSLLEKKGYFYKLEKGIQLL